MAQSDNKTRGTQLLRTDDAVPGVVAFYDRRQPDAQKAFIGRVSAVAMLGEAINEWAKGKDHSAEALLASDKMAAVLRAAIHGWTQNILDSSNKLEGDARVKFVREACHTVQQGGWASAPVDEEKLRENIINGMVKMGFTREAAIAAISAKKA